VIYTTNAIESVNARVRKIIKTRGHFPTDDAASKLIWLALRNITAGWTAFRRCLARANETRIGARPHPIGRRR
jgi:transposase-like protein